MADDLEVIVARIDERTKNMAGDIVEVKNTCLCLTTTVNEHSKQLAAIDEKVKNHNSPSRKQTLGFGGLGGVITGAVIAIIEYLKTH